MIQFTLRGTDKSSIADQAKMAIESGCSWLELDTKGLNDQDIQKLSDDIIPLCKERGVILVFTHNDIMVDRLRVHGIHLSEGDVDPLKLREKLGGHPIIGVDVTTESDFRHLRRADVDYVVTTNINPDNLRAIKNRMEADGVNIPIVAEGIIAPDTIKTLLDAGASGFNIDLRSLNGPHYAASLACLIGACN